MQAPPQQPRQRGEITDLRCGACNGLTQHLVSRMNPNGVEEWYCPNCHISWTADEYDERARRFRPRTEVVSSDGSEPDANQ